MQDTGNGSGQGWDKRAFSAQVAEWAIAVGDETGASVAHPARPLRRGVGGLAGAEHAHYRLKDAIDKPSSCGAASILTPPTTTPASSGSWWGDAIA